MSVSFANNFGNFYAARIGFTKGIASLKVVEAIALKEALLQLT